MALDEFFGVWAYDPSGADYGAHPPPRRGVYAIWPEGERLQLAAGWTDEADTRHATAVALVPDGSVQELPEARQVRGALEDGALVSEVFAEGTRVAFASRTLVDGGSALEVLERDSRGQTRSLYRRSNVKQVLCYRRDLKMRKGKIAAQCAHASLAVLLRGGRRAGLETTLVLTPEMAYWSARHSAKVVLSVEDEAALLAVHEEAKARGVPTALIRDSGRTEFGGVPTLTAVAVGPALVGDIDPITGRAGAVPTKLA